MKRIIFTLLAVISSLLLSAQTIVEKHGLLKVKDAHVVDENESLISLCGNSLFWSTNSWEGIKFYNADVVKFLKEDWKSSIVRAAMSVENDGYISDPDGQTAKIKTVVDACIENGLYVIIDFHTHSAERYPEQAVRFFTEMATVYGEYDNVIYEIFNEPIRQDWSNDIKPYAETVIAAIREVDPDNLIIVGTSSWSQHVDVASNDPIDDVNVAYTLHFYADTHKQDLRDKAITAMNNGVALFITEWGTCNASGDTGHNEASSDEWMNFCKENFISVCNWSICDKDETASSLKPGASSTGGWTDNDYTPSGKYVRNLMLNWVTCEPVLLPSTIEAENYCRLLGVQKQECSEGGYHMGDIDDGDWMSYQVTVEETGAYTVSYRIASPNEGGKIQLSGIGSLLESLDLPKTENLQDWTTVSHDVELPAGTYDLQIQALTGGFALNWIKIMPKTEEDPVLTTVTLYPADTAVNINTSIRLSAQGFDQNGNPFPINPTWSIADEKPGATIDENGLFTVSEIIDIYTVTATFGEFSRSVEIEVLEPCPAKDITADRIEAENYCEMFDIVLETTEDAGGGKNIGYLQSNSSWLTYKIYVPSTGTYWIDFRAANGNSSEGEMKISVDEEEVLIQEFAITGGWQVYETMSSDSFELTEGKHELKFEVLNGGFNLNWIKFTQKPVPYQPVLTTVTLYPADTTININESILLSAQGFDQKGNPFPINPTWSIDGDKPGATIDETGLFTASETVDNYTVTLTFGDFSHSVEIEVLELFPAKDITAGRIEAEDYTEAFDVTLETTEDEDGALNVGYLNDNSSWLTYTIKVPLAGIYWIDFRVANGHWAEGEMRISVDEEEVLIQKFAVTDGWQSYENTTTSSFELTEGKHELKFDILTGGFNINWFELRKDGEITSVPQVVDRVSEVYPNPVRKGEFLHLSSSMAISHIRMTDLKGVVVYAQTVDNKDELFIPTGGLDRGIYLLHLSSDRNQEVYKVIVE